MSSLEHFNDLEFNNIFASAINNSVNNATSVNSVNTAPPRLPSNTSLLQTGTFESHPSHTNYTHYALAQHRRFIAATVPRTPAIKPAPALETSPVTPGVPASSCQPPAPLHLPVAASDAGPIVPQLQAASASGVGVGAGYVEAPNASVHAHAHVGAGAAAPIAAGGRVMQPQVPADLMVSAAAPAPVPAPVPVHATGPGAVQALLKWVTREPVVLPGSYRPGNSVEKAFDAVRAGAPNALDAAMSELYRDVSQYVDKKKERKRHAHKSRLRQVEHRLSMEQREVARHRIEASLTKFKKTENEKALRSAMRWMGEQIAISTTQ